jgi:hypothetical protein
MWGKSENYSVDYRDATPELTALRAEVERLRGALRAYRQAHDNRACEHLRPSARGVVTCGCLLCKQACAALGEGEKGG